MTSATRRINVYPGTCRVCSQHIPAGGGYAVKLDGGWVVEHQQCPPNPHDTGEPTWEIGQGEGYGGSEYRPGQVLREQWWTGPDSEAPTADAVPGGRATSDDGRAVSGIVTVVSASKVYYREDGMSFGVGDEEGWYFSGRVRAATPEEAAPILAAEEKAARRKALAGRADTLLAWKYSTKVDDATYPPETETAGVQSLPEVPLGPEGKSRAHYAPRLVIDEPGGVVWTLNYNGGGGDDWGLSNATGLIAVRHPLTDARRQLVADLRAEYSAVDVWVTEDGYEQAAAQLLVAAGWTRPRLRDEVGAFAVKTATDAAAFLARTPEQWKAAGWSGRALNVSYGDVPATEVTQLVAAGLTSEQAGRLHHAGHTTVEAKLAVRPPQLPTTPGRFALFGPTRLRTAHTDDPAGAQEYLDRTPHTWGRWQHTPDVTCLHATGNYQLWSDGGITRGTWLPGLHRTDVPFAQRYPTVPDPAGKVLGLVAAAIPDTIKAIPQELRLTLATATAHTTTTVLGSTGRGGAEYALERHYITLGDGTTVTLWRVTAEAGGMSGGEGWSEEASWVYLEE